MVAISASVAPTSASRVTAVPRRSWNVTPTTPAFLHALNHDARKPSLPQLPPNPKPAPRLAHRGLAARTETRYIPPCMTARPKGAWSGSRPPPSLIKSQSAESDMNCRVCGANAEQIATTIDGATIVCPTCGEYDVTSSVIATGRLQALEPERRRDVLDKAKLSAQPGRSPCDHHLLARLGQAVLCCRFHTLTTGSQWPGLASRKSGRSAAGLARFPDGFHGKVAQLLRIEYAGLG